MCCSIELCWQNKIKQTVPKPAAFATFRSWRMYLSYCSLNIASLWHTSHFLSPEHRTTQRKVEVWYHPVSRLSMHFHLVQLSQVKDLLLLPYAHPLSNQTYILLILDVEFIVGTWQNSVEQKKNFKPGWRSGSDDQRLLKSFSQLSLWIFRYNPYSYRLFDSPKLDKCKNKSLNGNAAGLIEKFKRPSDSCILISIVRVIINYSKKLS